ncbi:hypothetical protein ABQJ54_04710 [Rhodanobacter sp. Si-c]|uniref:Lipoprotein n=1 Tax=Rhodanobacter lycopersici TaxID=3162487 RepID=A0ABV3QD23_9GAMM
MKRLFSGFVLVTLAALLSGCYYDPGYSYVRATPYAGPAYYGSNVVYGDGYYAAPGWYDGWYDGWYGYGCCYAPGVAIGGAWYGRGGGYRHYRGGGSWHGGSHGHVSSHGGSSHHH